MEQVLLLSSNLNIRSIDMIHHIGQIHLTERVVQLSGTMVTVKEKTKLMHTGMLVITKMEEHQILTRLFRSQLVLSLTMVRTLHQQIITKGSL